MGGNWPTGGGTLTFAASLAGSSTSSGTFGLVPTIPAGAATPITVAFTPTTAGYHLVTASNTLGLVDFGYVGISAFSANTGTNGVTISQTTSQGYTVKNDSVWERDVWKGASGGGWSSSFANGWARIDVALTLSGATSGLFVRVFDALSVGASTAVGTGALLHDKVQVLGALPSGAQTVRFNLPAFGLRKIYFELSADNGTTWYRIQKRILIGHRVIMGTRSYICGLTWNWAEEYTAQTPDFLTMAGGYALATTLTGPPANNNLYPTTQDWIPNDGARPGGIPSTSTSPGVMELSRSLSNAVGVPVGVIGSAIQGGAIKDRWSQTGQIDPQRILDAIPYATNGLTKARWALVGYNVDAFSDDEFRRNFDGVATWLRTYFTKSPILTCFELGDGYRAATNGTMLGGGFTRLDMIIRGLEEVRKDVVNSQSEWGCYYGSSGHADRGSAVIYARDMARAMLSRTDPAFGGFVGNTYVSPLGPRCHPSGGHRDAGSPYLKIPIQHRGGSAIVPIKASEVRTPVAGQPDNYSLNISPPSDVELGAMVTVRLRGQEYGYGRKAVRKNTYREPIYGVAVDIDPVQPVVVRNDLNEIWVKLNIQVVGGVNSILFKDGTTMPLTDNMGFAVAINGDFLLTTIVPNSTGTLRVPDVNGVFYWFADNNTSFNVPYGHTMQREMAYFVAPPTPGTLTASINSSPFSAINSGWLEVSGPPGSGPLLTDIKFSIDGGLKIDPLWEDIRADNSYHARLIAPSTTGSHTISLFANGATTPIDTKSFNCAPVASFIGGGTDPAYMNLSSAAQASYVESWSASNRLRQWKDASATQNASAQYDTIVCWDGDGPNGVANRLTTVMNQFNQPLPLPAIDLSSLCALQHDYSSASVDAYDICNRHVGVLFEGQYLGGPCAPLIAGVTGDFTLVAAHKGELGSYPFWMFTKPDGSFGMGCYYSNAWVRGSTVWSTGSPPIDATGVGSGLPTVNCYVLRFRASDGQMDVFSFPADGTAGRVYSNAFGPEVISLKTFRVVPKWGPIFYMGFFSSFFSGDMSSGDVGAAVTHLTNRWKT